MSRLPGDYRRTHVYAQVDYSQPKYLFQVVADRVEAAVGVLPAPRLLDVGGASGALAGYLQHRFPQARITSLDLDEELCEIGRQQLPGVRFIQGDANDMGTFANDEFHLATMIGTLSVFDDFAPALNECLRVTAPGGSLIVVGQFNDHPVDALIRYRYSGKERWNRGYNLFSHASIGRFLDAHPQVASYDFSPFELPFDLAPQADPIRSWTERDAHGRRFLRNGLNLIIDLQILEIRKRTANADRTGVRP